MALVNLVGDRSRRSPRHGVASLIGARGVHPAQSSGAASRSTLHVRATVAGNTSTRYCCTTSQKVPGSSVSIRLPAPYGMRRVIGRRAQPSSNLYDTLVVMRNFENHAVKVHVQWERLVSGSSWPTSSALRTSRQSAPTRSPVQRRCTAVMIGLAAPPCCPAPAVSSISGRPPAAE